MGSWGEGGKGLLGEAEKQQIKKLMWVVKEDCRDSPTPLISLVFKSFLESSKSTLSIKLGNPLK